jgi:DNA primase
MQVPETRGRPDKPGSAEAPALTARMMDALSYYRAELKKSRAAIDYLKGRGVSGEIAARYGPGLRPRRMAEPRGGVHGLLERRAQGHRAS